MRPCLSPQSGILTSVRWHRQQIRLCAGNARIKLLDDRGQKQRERIQRSIAAHVDDRKRPRLPVLDRSPEVCHLEFFMLSGRLSIDFQAVEHSLAILVGEEFGIVWKVVDEPVASDADEYGGETFLYRWSAEEQSYAD